MSSPPAMPLVTGYVPGSQIQVVHYREANKQPFVYDIPLNNGWLHYCNNHEFFLWTHFPEDASLDLYNARTFTFETIDAHSPPLYADPVVYPWIIIRNSELHDSECPGIQQHIKGLLDARAYAATLMDPIIVWENIVKARKGTVAGVGNMNEFIEEDGIGDDDDMDYVEEDTDSDSESESGTRTDAELEPEDEDEVANDEENIELTVDNMPVRSEIAADLTAAVHEGTSTANSNLSTIHTVASQPTAPVPAVINDIPAPEPSSAPALIAQPAAQSNPIPAAVVAPSLAASTAVHTPTSMALSAPGVSIARTFLESFGAIRGVAHDSRARQAKRTRASARHYPYRAPVPHNTIVYYTREDGHEVIDLTYLSD